MWVVEQVAYQSIGWWFDPSAAVCMPYILGRDTHTSEYECLQMLRRKRTEKSGVNEAGCVLFSE